MANDKKFVVKNGLTTQNIAFVDDVTNASNTITTSMLSTGTLSFSGSSGQLFSITDSLSGTIFAVNDISGVPSIEVDDDGTIRFAETTGNILIGTATDDGVNKLQVNGNIALPDNAKAVFGAGPDLEIYHDGTNSRIVDTGTGELRLQGTNLRLWSAAGENYLTAVADGTVSLYYDNAVKLATTTTGVDVTGDVNIDGGDVLFEGTSFTTTLTYTEPTAARTITFQNGTGTVAFLSDVTSSSNNTTYDLTVPTSTTDIRLAGSDGTNDDITITGGTNVTVTRTDANTITISSTDTNQLTTFTLTADSGSSQTIAHNDTLDIAGGTYISTVVGATDTVTVNHDNTTRSDTTSTDAPGYGGTFEAVTSVTTNATGHVTAIDVSTVTIPASDNTDTLGKNIVGASGTATADATATNGNVYINHIEGASTVKSSHNIIGSGSTTVTSDASGNITINSTDNNTTYDLTVPAATTAIRLAGSDATNDDITITGGTNVTVTRTSATELTIAATGGGAAIADDTTTNATRYLTFTDQTTGTEDTFNVASTKLYFNPSTGQLNATDFNALSDEALKTNIETIDNPLNKVKELRGVNFEWLENGKKSMGVIAQEVEKVIPEVVSDGETKSVNYNAMIGLLIEAIKEQQKEIDELKSRL